MRFSILISNEISKLTVKINFKFQIIFCIVFKFLKVAPKLNTTKIGLKLSAFEKKNAMSNLYDDTNSWKIFLH
jgi:hypothetical protein